MSASGWAHVVGDSPDTGCGLAGLFRNRKQDLNSVHGVNVALAPTFSRILRGSINHSVVTPYSSSCPLPCDTP